MSASLRDVFVVDAVRTPVGRFRGALADVRPDDLGAVVIGEVVRRAGADPAGIDDVFFGCANQAGEDNRNVARMSLLLAGLPVTVPGATVNRLCGSGLQAVIDGVRAIAVGEADLVIAGGVESMSRAPLVMPKAREAFPRGDVVVHDSTLGWRFVNPRMEALYGTHAAGRDRRAGGGQARRHARGAGRVRAHQPAPLGGGARGGALRRRAGRGVAARQERRPQRSTPTSTRARRRPPPIWPRCRPRSASRTGR